MATADMTPEEALADAIKFFQTETGVLKLVDMSNPRTRAQADQAIVRLQAWAELGTEEFAVLCFRQAMVDIGALVGPLVEKARNGPELVAMILNAMATYPQVIITIMEESETSLEDLEALGIQDPEEVDEL